MPQIVLPALLSATVSTAPVGFVGFGQAFLVNAALGAGMYALAPKPTTQVQGPQTFTVKSSNETRKLLYGEARIGGVLTFPESTDNETNLHWVVTFVAHEVDSFQTFYIDGEALTLSGNDVTAPAKYAGLIKVYPVTVGAVANTPASLIADTSWTSAHVLTGQAYAYFRYTGGDGVFSGGPPNISAVIRGYKIYDTRTATTSYSANPVMVIRDYLMDTTYGLGAASTEINETAFEAAANICDEAVTLDVGGTEPRYTLNGVVDTAPTPRTNLGALLTSLNGVLYFSGDQWSIKAGAYNTPTVTLTEDDFAGPIETATAVSARDSFNAVKGQYVSSETDYQPTDYVEVVSATFETEDGGFRKYANLNLPYTNSGAMGQRIAKQVLYQNRQKISLSADFKLTAFKLEVGDTAMLTLARYGWTAKVFEVISWDLDFGPDRSCVKCSLRETNSAVYSWDAEETAFLQDNSNLPDITMVNAPTSLSMVAGVALNGDGAAVPKVTVTWDVLTTNFVDHYEFQYKLTAATNYTAVQGTSGEFIIQPVIAANGYTSRVRAVNSFGVRSAWATATTTSVGDTTAPAGATSIAVAADNKSANLTWVNPTDTDFAYVQIWQHTADIWGSSSVVGDASGTSHTVRGLTNGNPYYFWLTSVDKSGNVSTQSTSVTATPIGLASTDFASTIAPVEILASLPAFGSAGRIVFLTSDNQLYRDTGSAWTKAVAAVDITGTLSDSQLAAIASTKITGTLTNAQLDAIAAAKITGTISDTQLAAGSVVAGKIAAGTIVAADIAASTITGAKIAATTIAAANIVGATITGAQIAATTVAAANIVAGTITATQIATGTITSNELAANSIIAGKIAVGAINIGMGVFSGPLQSDDFVTTVSGWRITVAGLAEFNDLINRKALIDGSVSNGGNSQLNTTATHYAAGASAGSIALGAMVNTEAWRVDLTVSYRHESISGSYIGKTGLYSGTYFWSRPIVQRRTNTAAVWSSWVTIDDTSSWSTSYTSYDTFSFSGAIMGDYDDTEYQIILQTNVDTGGTYASDLASDPTANNTNIKDLYYISQAVVK